MTQKTCSGLEPRGGQSPLGAGRVRPSRAGPSSDPSPAGDACWLFANKAVLSVVNRTGDMRVSGRLGSLSLSGRSAARAGDCSSGLLRLIKLFGEKRTSRGHTLALWIGPIRGGFYSSFFLFLRDLYQVVNRQ